MYFRFFVDEKLKVNDRKRYITSFIGKYGKLGAINKFNNAIGFKEVCFDPIKRTFPDDNMCPDGYQAPALFLFSNMHIEIDDYTVVEFSIPDTNMIHPNDKYTYNTFDIFLKFTKFVEKVYPGIRIQEIACINDSIPSRILNHFYLSLAESDCIDAEISCSRLINDEEKEYILNALQPITNRKIDIEQFYCKTCAMHDASHPYHIMIEFAA